MQSQINEQKSKQMNKYSLEGNICLIKPKQLFLIQPIFRKIAFCLFIMNFPPLPLSCLSGMQCVRLRVIFQKFF